MGSPVAQGAYTTARVDGEHVVSAGMTPRDDDQRLVASGVVGEPDGVSVEGAVELAELAGLRAVDACAGVLPTGGRLSEAVTLTVFVRSGSDFEQHSTVADGASRAVEARLGGVRPARAAVGVVSLPGGAPVEVQLTCRWVRT